MYKLDPEKIKKSGKMVVNIEAIAVNSISSCVDDKFVLVCEYILNCMGKVITIGMGKSGHVAAKVAATLASTGTPAFFVHPGEAGHGDLGMFGEQDVVLAFSNSGETYEIVNLLSRIKRLGIVLISLTSQSDSTLAKASQVNIDVGIKKEACPLGLAPTASTTASLVMGDAIAIALLEARGFDANDYALSHPSGSLGKKLLCVRDIMHAGNDMPYVNKNALLKDALVTMSVSRLGVTAVVEDDLKIVGIITDGDLRRKLSNIKIDDCCVTEVMTKECKTIHQDFLVIDALSMMEQYKINAFLVADEYNTLIGVLNIHDLLGTHAV